MIEITVADYYVIEVERLLASLNLIVVIVPIED